MVEAVVANYDLHGVTMSQNQYKRLLKVNTELGRRLLNQERVIQEKDQVINQLLLQVSELAALQKG